MRKKSNPGLKTIKPGWEGNPLQDGKYINVDPTSVRGFKEIWKWKSKSNPYADEKKNQTTNVEVLKNRDFLMDKSDGFTWIGHATFLLRLAGKTIITDPILFGIWPLKRYTEFPCNPEAFNKVDYICLTHNHRDHCDKKSLKFLCKLNPDAVILTGLEIGGLLGSWGIKNQVIESGWYQEYFSSPELSISYLPARHWNKRLLFDINTMLWGSFMFRVNEKLVYFGADSGIGSHFEEIQKLFDPIDYAFLGIGAYKPVWFMRESHTSPADIVQIRGALKAKKVIPFHYGTFDLSDEPIGNPKEVLKKITDGNQDYLYLTIGKKVNIDG